MLFLLFYTWNKSKMKIKKFKNKEQWLEFRRGKISGTKLKNILTLRGSSVKKGVWELIAERIATPSDSEDPMERGLRLESTAMELFSKATKKKVDNSLVIWVSDEDSNIMVSPDGMIGKTEALENKCLNSASHIEAYITQKIPQEYEFQIIQYFIVNEKLKTLYFSFYDPRVVCMPFFYLKIQRKDLAKDIVKYKEEQIKILSEVDRIIRQLNRHRKPLDLGVWHDA